MNAPCNDDLSRSREMVARLARLAPVEGYNLTPLPDVRLLRSNRPLSRTPVLYDPGIVIVCQGRKRGYWGNELFVYDARHYLAVAVPVPFTMETEASADEPLLAIYLHLDFNMAADVLLQLNEHDDDRHAAPRGLYSSPMEKPLEQSVLRLLEVLGSPMDSRVLGPALVREIYYRVLTGDQGGSLRAALGRQGQFGKISRAIRKIHTCLDQALDVEQLAREVNMSVPTFHAHFKNVTQTSPMQYLKSTRLHQARLLMLRQGLNVSKASMQVGYESPSQFSREFKRLFGLTPSDEVNRMKQSFALPPPAAASIYVSSH